MKFVEGVSRILRKQGILRGDDDAVTSFSDTQHSHPIQLAQIAIQEELNYLMSQPEINNHLQTGSGFVTPALPSYAYALNSNFIAFEEDKPVFYKCNASNEPTGTLVRQYPGGWEAIRKNFPKFATDSGDPTYWYWVNDQRGVGFWPNPAAGSTTKYQYYYRQNIQVEDEDDTFPFRLETHAYQFCDVVARRFDILFKVGPKEISDVPESDQILLGKRSNLINMILGQIKPQHRGRRYYTVDEHYWRCDAYPTRTR